MAHPNAPAPVVARPTPVPAVDPLVPCQLRLSEYRLILEALAELPIKRAGLTFSRIDAQLKAFAQAVRPDKTAPSAPASARRAQPSRRGRDGKPTTRRIP